MTTEASNLSALGKALDQTSISSSAVSPGGIPAAPDSVPNDTDGAAGDEEEEDDDAYADDYGDDDDEANDLLMDFENDGNDDDEDDDDEADDDDLVPLVPTGPPKKSPPKKRERTDSLKKMLPAPAAQRAKQFPDDANATSPGDSESNSEDWSAASGSQDSAHVKLMVKDRKGGGMGVPNAHSILTAVKQAPPAKEKSNPRRWSKHEVHLTQWDPL